MPVQTAYQGVSYSPNEQLAPPLPLGDASDFELLASPARYDVYVTAKGPEILPVLRTVTYRGGIHNIPPFRSPQDPGAGPGRTGDCMPYIATQTRPSPGPGYVHVPSTITVKAFGEDRKGYAHGFATRGGGWHFMDVWRRPYMIGSDVVDFERDEAGYHDFLRMVQSEYLPPINQKIRKNLENRLKSLQRDYKRAERDTEAIDAKVKVFDVKKRAAKPRAGTDA